MVALDPGLPSARWREFQVYWRLPFFPVRGRNSRGSATKISMRIAVIGLAGVGKTHVQKINDIESADLACVCDVVTDIAH